MAVLESSLTDQRHGEVAALQKTVPPRFFWTFDLLAFTLAFVGAYALVPALQGLALLVNSAAPLPPNLVPLWPGALPPASTLLWIFLVVTVCGLLTLAALGAYRSPLNQSRTFIAASSALAVLSGAGLVALVLFALRDPDWSRAFVFTFTSAAVLALSGYRWALRAYVRGRWRAGAYALSLLLVGTPPALRRILPRMSTADAMISYNVAGYLRVPTDHDEAYPEELQYLGGVNDLSALLIRRPIHEVIAVHSAAQSPWLSEVLTACDQAGVPVHVVDGPLLEASTDTLRPLGRSGPLGLPVVTLASPHADSEALFLKRALDILVSAALLLFLSPLLGLIALLIRLTSGGPVLYPWKVIGDRGHGFTGYKFRTMVPDADSLKHQLLALNEMNGPVFKMAADPRVTPLGRFLRRYSLDELPQLYSVLKGDMSLVGPRPASEGELARYEFWQKRKLSIRPGITCLWQVRGRNAISDFDDWVRMDLEYIDNWSLWLDLKILAWTALAVARGTGR